MTPDAHFLLYQPPTLEVGRHDIQALQFEGRWDDLSNEIKSALLSRIAPLHEKFEAHESRAWSPRDPGLFTTTTTSRILQPACLQPGL